MLTSAGRDLAIAAALGTHIGLVTAISDFRAGTVTAASFTGYARAAVTWGSAANTSPTGGRQVANSGAVTFAANTGSNQDVIGWTSHSAITAGTIYDIGLFGTIDPVVGTAFTDDTITAKAHGFTTDLRVFVMAAPGALLPAGLAENTAYYVLASGLTTDVFKLSTTSGGSAVDITAIGSALFLPYTPVTILAGSTPSFANGVLITQF